MSVWKVPKRQLRELAQSRHSQNAARQPDTFPAKSSNEDFIQSFEGKYTWLFHHADWDGRWLEVGVPKAILLSSALTEGKVGTVKDRTLCRSLQSSAIYVVSQQ